MCVFLDKWCLFAILKAFNFDYMPLGTKDDPIHIRIDESVLEAAVGAALKAGVGKGTEKLLDVGLKATKELIGLDAEGQVSKIEQVIQHQTVENQTVNIQKDARWWIWLSIGAIVGASLVKIVDSGEEQNISALKQKCEELQRSLSTDPLH